MLGAPEPVRAGRPRTASARRSGAGGGASSRLRRHRRRRSASLDPASGPAARARGCSGSPSCAEELRPTGTRDRRATSASEGIALIVLSGDDPATVAAIAADVGLPAGRARSTDASCRPSRTSCCGPSSRRSSSDASRRRASVAWSRRCETRDGTSRWSATASTTCRRSRPHASRSRRAAAPRWRAPSPTSSSSEADFDAVPRLVAEGRQILRNMQRVSKIYATKCVFGALVVLTLGLSPLPYPFLPRQLSFASFFVTGVPPFFLALARELGPLADDRLPTGHASLCATGGLCHRDRGRHRATRSPTRCSTATCSSVPHRRAERLRPGLPLRHLRARGDRPPAGGLGRPHVPGPRPAVYAIVLRSRAAAGALRARRCPTARRSA